MSPNGVFQSALVVPEKRGGFLIHSAQLAVREVRNAGIDGEGARMYINGHLRRSKDSAAVVDAHRSHPLHGAQSGAMRLLLELRVVVLARVGSMGSEEVGDGGGPRDLRGEVDLMARARSTVASRRWEP